jgi:tripartite-type tricarboxylate transporter receptor subunit TctC
MKRRTFVGMAASAAVLPALQASAQAYPWRPERPVTIIVPWAAGGSTDQMARVVAAELESELGQRFVVVNQPGASGSIGTRNALEAARDGYTWAAGAAVDVGTYKVLGLLDTMLADWHLFFAVANVSVISVNPNTPFRDFGQLLEALKTRGQTIPVATAGLSSAGHNMMEMIRAAVPGLQYRHVTYEGGNPAVVATVAGETQAVSQLLVEMTEMIRGNRLRPLVALSDKPVPLSGFGEIPPITRWVPGMVAPVNYFGIWIPKGAPEPVVRSMTMAWERKIANSEALKKYAENRSAIFTPIHGEEAFNAAMRMVTRTAWLYHDAGKTKLSPDTVGIARP